MREKHHCTTDKGSVGCNNVAIRCSNETSNNLSPQIIQNFILQKDRGNVNKITWVSAINDVINQDRY